MNLSEQLMADYIQAMKNKDALKKEILNYIVSQIKYKKIELQQDPSDADVIQIIKKEIKAREESMEYLTKSGNMDELNLEVSRIEIMKTYLPEMMPKDQLEILVKKFIAELGIADPKKERGVVIQAVMKDHKSVIDGKMLNEIINGL